MKNMKKFKNYKIDILIPTFNRKAFLLKNLRLLNEQIAKFSLEDKIRILISDNASSDGTYESVIDFSKENPSLNIEVFKNNSNIGLEKNAVSLLQKATSEYVMYLGDDDYLPHKYLKEVIGIINQKDVACIIPGINALFPNGEIKKSRFASFKEKEYNKGFLSLLKVSHFGHQLSGLTFLREGVYESYIKKPEFRNIYPFIYFVGFNTLRGNTIYVPKFKVLVSVGNKKDWNYDDSGLLSNIVKNYSLLFGKRSVKKCLGEISFITKQSWRLRIAKNPKFAFKSFVHLIKSKEIHLLTKFILPFIYLYFYFKKTILKILKVINTVI